MGKYVSGKQFQKMIDDAILNEVKTMKGLPVGTEKIVKFEVHGLQFLRILTMVDVNRVRASHATGWDNPRRKITPKDFNA